MKETKQAFTLIELMVVCVIIVLLAMLASTAYFGAMQMAREVKTSGTISKLDAAISDIYESYEFRFEHIEDALNRVSRETFNNNKAAMSEIDIVRLKRFLMYDLMRMEMPSNRAEVHDGPSDFTIAGGTYTLESPAVRGVYRNVVPPLTEATTSNLATESAELLYLIIANLDPEALENLTASEIGDTDGNGLLEFIDGWGRPIAFIRFAPGFAGTDRQPDLIRIREALSLASSNDLINGSPPLPENERIRIINQWQDPFDPEMLTRDSWFLYPVIVSAGRDGLWGIEITRVNGNSSSDPPISTSDPFSTGATIGRPDDSNSHHDNIHNHSNFR
ncbi:MAG: prepilin-type N-terminal cleavage/methylation domain-containing protein [Planctomycetaceae bacterium]|jgi:prepilin-type N-terminal cleavage/methylation domain-containing protein|nr:prepilin-type N-terminal cleavage/methylation domain-containing protein [Planctomycetaceae bacterium]